jgi:hypothetical protein
MVPFALRPLAELLTGRQQASVYPIAQVGLVPRRTVTIDGSPFELPEYFDNTTAIFRDLSAFKKRRPGLISPMHRTTVCVHNTGAKFGTTSAARARWLKRSKGLEGEAASQWAMMMALFERFWDVPYHYVGLSCGYVVKNQPTHWYTYHGGLANRSSIGWSMEGSYPAFERSRSAKHTPMTELVIETGRQSLRLAVLDARAQGCPIRFVQPHRCYARNRAADPGEAIWKEIVLPVSHELGLVPDYSLHEGDGLPVPSSWDKDALYDDSGKPLRRT